MSCTINHCPKDHCPYPPTDPMFMLNIRELYGYCPYANIYFDLARQEEYEASKKKKQKINPLKFSKRR